ncbi:MULTISPECIES: alpha/beta hydrolase [Paenibacillus]|nr:alpha/beta hydrolase-fold protein [Paenibacillus anaericanus]
MKLFKALLCTLVILLAVGVGQQTSIAASSKIARTSSNMNVKFYSESLKKDMILNVYLPPNYDCQDKYPVLYVLHSYKLNENHWFNDLKITEKADELIASGKIEPMIIVAPRIDNSFGVNSSELPGFIKESGNPTDEGVLYTGKYEDYVTNDVVSFVDTHFNTIKSRQSRYIGGTSMGGFSALHIGLRHPQLFSKIGGHSPALFVGEMWAPLEKLVYPTAEARQNNDPIALAASQKLNKVSIYVDYGDQDDFKEVGKKLDEVLKGQKIKSYEFHINPGGHHDDAYWSSQMENYLQFYGGIDQD